MASRKNPSLHWRNRNKSDLIDLSNEIEDTAGNNILNLFDPLNHVDEKSNIRRATINYETPATPPNPARLKSPVPRSHHSATTNRRNVEKPSDKIEPCSPVSNESAASQSSTASSASSSGVALNVEAEKIDSGLETKQLNRLSLQDDKPKPETRRRVDRDLSGPFADGGKLKLARKHQRSSQELALLTKKIKSFRARYKNHDLSSNPGIIYSPTLYGFKNQDMSVKIVITSPLASAPLSFTCCISTTIEHLISHAVCTIFDSLGEDDSMDKFMLKVTGKDEYFSPEKKLADYALVSHCCKFDRDVGLSLIRTSAIRRPFLRTSQDDFRFKSLLCPDDLLSRTAVLKFSDLNYESLSITTITFDREAKRLYNDVTNRASSIQPQKLLQCTKAICSLMMSCESGQLSESKDNLAELCKSYRANGDSLNDEDRYKMIEVIQHAIKRLVQNMKRLLILTSNCLPVDYELEDVVAGDRSNKNAFVDTTIDSIKEPVTLRVQLVSQLKPEWITKYHQFHLAIALKHGQSLISPIVDTCKVKPETSFFPRLLFEENLTIPVNYSVLPREVRVCMTLVGTELPMSQPNADDSIDSDEPGQLNRTNSSTSIRSTAPICASSPKDAQVSNSSSKPTNEIVTRELAVSMTYLFDHDLNILQGDRLLYMHPIESDQFEDIYIETVVNRTDPILLVELKKFPPEKKIFFPRDIEAAKSDEANGSYNFNDLAPGVKYVLELIIFKKQSYEELADDEKDLLWQNRLHLRSITEALPKVLLSVADWSVMNLPHIYHLIDTWKPLEAIDAIQLMLPSFPDVRVRQKAIDWISAQEDDELYNYLPQLLQAFNYEKTLDCPLFWLLMTRALKNVRIANLMYWQLKLLSRDNLLQERGETLMNCLLWVCGSAFWKSMDKQENMLNQLSRVSGEIKKLRDGKRMKVLHKMLERVQDYLHEEKPAMPWAPSLEVCDLDMKSCSYFPSNKLPLKLAFRSCEESCNRVVKFHTYDTIFKVGDDLRQDMLAIQMIRIMEKLWLREGLDLRMVTFDCLATNDRQGMVEVVKNAETLRKIQQSSGYLAGAFDPKAIDNYLRQWNTSELEYQTALDKFLHSCAGYTIATYILGICDRHNDNIMVTNSGHLFHIDFGKFLGDAQMMGPIKRDRTPFVLTADMAYVINGGDRPTNKFKTFIELCAMGLNIIRRHRNLFLNLFSLMSSANIHGLNKESVKYVDRMLMPNLSEREAMTKFTRLIEECLNSKATQVNFFIHNLAQLRFKSK